MNYSMKKTYYDINILTKSGESILIKGLTNSALNSIPSNNMDTIDCIIITKQYEKKIR